MGLIVSPNDGAGHKSWVPVVVGGGGGGGGEEFDDNMMEEKDS